MNITFTCKEQLLVCDGSGSVRLEKFSKVIDSLLHDKHCTVDLNKPCQSKYNS